MPASCARSSGTRRTATVTISAPDAATARAILSLSAYLPVPTLRREWKVRPPMRNGVSRAVATVVVTGSAAPDEVHQLYRVPRGDPNVAERGAAYDRAVVLHHDGARVELERREDFEQRRAPRHRVGL